MDQPAHQFVAVDHPDYVNLRSGASITRSFARFYNRTKRVVDVFWVDFNGRHVRYATLKANSWVDVDTFVTHPWIFRDRNGGQPLLILPSRRFVYFPAAPRLEQGQPTRRVAVIGIPITSLQERCLQILRPFCERLTPTDVDTLDIPWTLRTDLKDAVVAAIGYRSALHRHQSPQ